MALFNQNQRSPTPCSTWIWSSSSDVHICKDPRWFNADFLRFDTYAIASFGTAKFNVLGVGSVSLSTKAGPGRAASKRNRTLHLNTVLYAPDSPCNIVGNPIEEDYDLVKNLSRDGEDKIGTIKTPWPHCCIVGYFEPVFTRHRTVLKLHLSGPPTNAIVDAPLVFSIIRSFTVNAFWPEVERDKFELFQKSSPAWQPLSAAALTPNEQVFVDLHYGSEYKFLLAHGLNINREKDRERGRAILRRKNVQM